jgi:dTMP kinase
VIAMVRSVVPVERTYQSLRRPHPFPGSLIVVEGTDGSGKSTQVRLLEHHLQAEGFGVFFTEWNSSRLISKAIKKAKKRGLLTPRTFSILHAVDFADRLVSEIIPALKSGMVVLADRYAFTAFARDVARGVDPQWVRSMYSFATRPDAAFFFRVPVEVSLGRISLTHTPSFYEAGMDLNLADDPFESYRLFQGMIVEQYDKMVEEFQIRLISAEGPIEEQQEALRREVMELLARRQAAAPPAPTTGGKRR